MSQLTPLHVHTYFSSLGGPHSPKEWCSHAASLGYQALGVADRAPLAAYSAFAAAAREAGIKPLFGVELDLLLSLPPHEEPKSKKSSKTATPVLSPQSSVLQPILLFARNQEGLGNLAKLSAIAFDGWPQREQPVEWEALTAHVGGLLVILLPTKLDCTAPLGSVQPRRLSELGASLHEVFDGLAFMGLPAPFPDDDTRTRQAHVTANYLGLPPVALPTANYLSPDDATAFSALLAARTSAGWSLPITHHVLPTTHSPLLPPDEASAIFSLWPEAVEAAASLPQMCEEIDSGALVGAGLKPDPSAACTESSNEDIPDQKIALSPRERYLRREWEQHNLGAATTEAPEMDALLAALDSSGALRSRLLTTAQISNDHLGKSVIVVGLLYDISLAHPTPAAHAALRTPHSALPESPIATAQIEDLEGSIELVAFPPNYRRHQSLWTEAHPVIVTARVAAHPDGELYLLCEHLASLNTSEEEQELKLKIKGQSRAAKDPVPNTEVLATARDQKSEIRSQDPGNGALSGANGHHPSAITHYPSPASNAQPAAVAILPSTGESARYRVVISLPAVDDDQEAIDAMIALNQAFDAHPGSDIMTVRLPYLRGTPHVATFQFPRGVNFTPTLRHHLETLFNPQALAVIELA